MKFPKYLAIICFVILIIIALGFILQVLNLIFVEDLGATIRENPGYATGLILGNFLIGYLIYFGIRKSLVVIRRKSKITNERQIL